MFLPKMAENENTKEDPTNYSYLSSLICNENPSPPTSPPPTLKQMREINKQKDKYLEQYNFSYCESANKYSLIAKIGQGTFGEVFKARCNKNPKLIVAMKKIFMINEKNGFPMTSLREIRILQQLRHQNIVRLLEICQTDSMLNPSRSTFYLVFEFCEHDLSGLLSNSHLQFNLEVIKNVLQQMLNGLHFIHVNKILHRDLKAANVLITKTGILKLADFGLARAFSTGKIKIDQANKFTNNVVTLWYRAPELLLGERNYGSSIDLWAVGCIMAEMWTRFPIMQGNSEQSQLKLISNLCGSITPEVWPNVVSLALYNQIELEKGQKSKIQDKFKSIIPDPLAIELLEQLLTLDPEKRIDAHSALDHQFFWTDPMPCDLIKVISQLQTSNYEYLAKHKCIHHPQSSVVVNQGHI